MIIYKRYRFPPNVISYAVWLYHLRERGMRRFKSVGQAQRFLGVHAAVYNLFNLGRHLIRAEHYRNLREGAFGRWVEAVA